MIQEIEFAPDSPLEEAGFERSVPRKIADAAETRLFALAASLAPSERRLVCERDRRFESSSLQGRVECEPDLAPWNRSPRPVPWPVFRWHALDPADVW